MEEDDNSRDSSSDGAVENGVSELLHTNKRKAREASENGPRPKRTRRPVRDSSEREQSEVMDGGREEEEEYRGNEEERADDEATLEEEDRLARETGDLGRLSESGSCYLVYGLSCWEVSIRNWF
jgi:hypothetical protein